MEWPTLWGEAVDQVPINNLIPTLNEQLFLCQPLAVNLGMAGTGCPPSAIANEMVLAHDAEAEGVGASATAAVAIAVITNRPSVTFMMVRQLSRGCFSQTLYFGAIALLQQRYLKSRK